MKPWKFEEKKKNYQIYRSFDGRVESKNFGKFWKNFGIFWKINIFWNCPITTIAQNSYLIWSDTLLVCHSEWPKDKPFLLMHSSCMLGTHTIPKEKKEFLKSSGHFANFSERLTWHFLTLHAWKSNFFGGGPNVLIWSGKQ